MPEQKKPNTFAKGMMSDIDANILQPDTYQSATNARRFTRGDNSFVLKSAKGTSEFTSLELAQKLYVFSHASIINNTVISALTDPSVKGIRMDVSGDLDFATTSIEVKSGDIIGSWGGALYGASVSSLMVSDVTTPNLVWLVIMKALANEAIASKLNMSITSNADSDSVNLTTGDLTTEVMSLQFRAFISNTNSGGAYAEDYQSISVGDGYTLTTYASLKYNVVGMAQFSNYVVAICTTPDGDGEDAIFRFTPSEDGSLATSELILKTDLGLDPKTAIRIEVSEENEHFHRIYWTDGNQPLRTVNLKEDLSYYSTITAEDLNVFKLSKLLSPNVTAIIDGGAVSCGSHSYCYKLMTTDGKTSRVSAITNPVQILKTDSSKAYHKSFGGSLEDLSSNGVQLVIEDIDPSFTTIQVIDITYISAEGAITADIISEGFIYSSTYKYTHNGYETKTPISIGELLRSHASWDVCADLAIKDNRLFAANLKNNTHSVNLDFKVKSYKYASDGTGTASTYDDLLENPDIHEDILYKDGQYGWINAADNVKVPGAETEDFDNSEDGLRITFATKTFDLSKVKYFENLKYLEGTPATPVSKSPQYGFLSGDGGGYNNYKNPLFTKDYTGYQRGEVYRFGILFYDNSGNPGFVSPIGDVRMPDGAMDYISTDSSGNRITSNDEGVTTFKHAGNIPVRSSGWSFSSGSNTLSKTGGGLEVALYDVISGVGIPPHTTVFGIAADNNSITTGRATTSSGTSTTLTFDTTTSDVKGFALYPQFNVKLSTATRDKIGGYAIVRVDREVKDRSILASGVLNQTIIHANTSNNDSLKHKNGHHYGNIYSGYQAHECLSNADFTLDSPEILLGGLQYTRKDGDKLVVSGVLNAGAEAIDSDTFNDDSIVDDAYITHLRQIVSNDDSTDTSMYETGSVLSGRFDSNSNDKEESARFTQKVIYSQFKSGISDFNATTEGEKVSLVLDSEIVLPGGDVDKSKMGYDVDFTGRTNQNFTNRCRFSRTDYQLCQFPMSYSTDKYDSEEWAKDDDVNYQNNDDRLSVTLYGVTTLFLSTGDDNTNQIEHADFEIGTGSMYSYSPFVLNRYFSSSVSGEIEQTAYAAKLYTQLRRNVTLIQYGGSLPSNYEQNQYISTGYINFSPTASNFDEVFGGDTYINMYALKKFFIGAETFGATKVWPSTAIMFPVESSVNLDLRDGDFFGSEDDMPANVEEDMYINETYKCRNTSKTYLQKPDDFKSVNNYSNLIAASNLKLAGAVVDAFASWDANEIHELDNNRGGVYSLFSLRNELFAVQQKGVAKLSINPRVVVDSADAAAVTIVTGTGQVIQRSDYIDTLYGSQHYNNLVVTNTSAYWYDSYMSSFCKLVFGKGIAVQDLGITTQNSNIFYSLKDIKINDSPLDYDSGGICLYHDQLLDEVGICITGDSGQVLAHLVYSELSDLMITKKKDAIALALNMPGELITIGRNSASDSLISNKIWRENSSESHISYYGEDNDSSLDITFVCNESVYTSKKFDKLVVYLSGNSNEGKFTTFEFVDSLGNTITNTGDNLGKMRLGKHILPIRDLTGSPAADTKMKGNYLVVTIKSNATEEIELFSALVHHRTINI
tara:strand:+ start:1445 stop:6253 length:4809 start_codon:yes stop_codon:yes gene_type:complete